MEQPEQPQLAGLLGAAVDEINADEDASRGLAVLAKVGALDAYRDEVLRLGVAVPPAHNGLRLFADTTFADEAMTFFGPPPQVIPVESYLQERFIILRSQKTLVDYVNLCQPTQPWFYRTRAEDLDDFNELKLEVKVACPIYFDEETGALKYTEPGFVDAFVDCITRRYPDLKTKKSIQWLCTEKRRLRRKCGAVVDAARAADAMAAAPAAHEEPAAPQLVDLTQEESAAPPQLVDLTDEAPDATRKKRSLEDTSGGGSPQASKKAKKEEEVEDHEEYFPVFKACIVAGFGFGFGFLGTG